MNIHLKSVDRDVSREEAEEALSVLQDWAKTQGKGAFDVLKEAAAYPAFSRDYPEEFAVDPSYKASLPDLQNGPSSLIKGANRAIQHVGISNFRLPVRFRMKDGGERQLDCSVTGSVNTSSEAFGGMGPAVMMSKFGTCDWMTHCSIWV